MDNKPLEYMFHWLSDDIVRFKIEVGVEEKCTKCNRYNTQNGHSRSMPCPDGAFIMAYINTQCSASKYTITACQAKVKFKVSVWT